MWQQHQHFDLIFKFNYNELNKKWFFLDFFGCNLYWQLTGSHFHVRIFAKHLLWHQNYFGINHLHRSTLHPPTMPSHPLILKFFPVSKNLKIEYEVANVLKSDPICCIFYTSPKLGEMIMLDIWQRLKERLVYKRKLKKGSLN